MNNQLLSIMITTGGVCALVGIAGIVASKAREKNSPARSKISATIKCKNVAYFYMVSVLAFIALISGIVAMLASEKINLVLLSVLFVIEIAIFGALAIGMGTLRKILLYENEFEIYMPYSQTKPRYGYADVVSADQNRDGDVTLNTRDGREYTLKRMTDANEMLRRINNANSEDKTKH